MQIENCAMLREFCVAYRLLEDAGDLLRPGDAVIVDGASGAIGGVVVQVRRSGFSGIQAPAVYRPVRDCSRSALRPYLYQYQRNFHKHITSALFYLSAGDYVSIPRDIQNTHGLKTDLFLVHPQLCALLKMRAVAVVRPVDLIRDTNANAEAYGAMGETEKEKVPPDGGFAKSRPPCVPIVPP
jgi:hypothetical protein